MSRILAPLALTAGLLKPIAAWIHNVNDRRTLADMPDYLLKDIGLRRDQIESMVNGGGIRGEATPAPAQARSSAEVIAITPGKTSQNPARPEKPMAA